MICIDNSEFARNSDYNPSRLDAQTDCANVVAGAKTQQHPENVVGVALMAGDRVDIRLNPSTDIGRVLAVLAEIPVQGESCDLIRTIQTSSIALKHRQNKNQKQRIICFVGSPVTAPEKQLEQMGKILKKNNVSIDVISMGDVDGSNRSKLEKLVDSANSGGTSHFIEVEPNSGKVLSDVIATSPILMPEGMFEAGGMGGAGDMGGDFGFDPSMDPELAMAIRLSMEEERQRQAAATAGAGGSNESAGSTSQHVNPASPAAATYSSTNPQIDEFDAELRAALLASMEDVGQASAGAPQSTGDVEMDEELRKALAESMEDWDNGPTSSTGSGDDSALIAELVATLPGVDVNDPRFQEALRHLREQRGKK